MDIQQQQFVMKSTVAFRLLLARCHVAAVLIVTLVLCGCNKESENSALDTPMLRLATTTSVRDSGLLDELLAAFQEQHQVRIDVIAVGTGAALKLASAGDADLVIVHAPRAEQEFVDNGYGRDRTTFMRSHFVIVGPSNDPAEIKSLDAIPAMQRIANHGAKFVSRGDDSGTHKREAQIWDLADRQPGWSDYISAGNGMAATLLMADELYAYTVTDEPTFLRLEDKTDLRPLVRSGEILDNPYSVILTNPEIHADINQKDARLLARFLTSPQASQIIDNYTIGNEKPFEVISVETPTQ